MKNFTESAPTILQRPTTLIFLCQQEVDINKNANKYNLHLSFTLSDHFFKLIHNKYFGKARECPHP